MSTDAKLGAEAQRAALSKIGTLARFAVIAAALGVIIGSFAYIGGSLTGKDLRPVDFADEFERIAGVHSGFRRNHAKGVGVSGYFEPKKISWRAAQPDLAERGQREF